MSNPCAFFHFGLIVTGESERLHVHKLLKSLPATRICSVKVIKLVGQRSPITSPKKKIKMVGKGKTIPTKDERDIALPARRYLQKSDCHFVMLIDDLEYARREIAQQVFDRYRLAFDAILTKIQRGRATVHFLVNMLEAYYFADAAALNKVLQLDPPQEDYGGDVETIRHPKNKLKQLYPGFDEVGDGGRILDIITIEHVLSRPNTCTWLRTLFAWCESILRNYPDLDYYNSLALSEKYCLSNGMLSEITRVQINDR